jgi:hypothetical protein
LATTNSAALQLFSSISTPSSKAPAELTASNSLVNPSSLAGNVQGSQSGPSVTGSRSASGKALNQKLTSRANSSSMTLPSVNGGGNGGNNHGADGTMKLASSIGGNFSGLGSGGPGAPNGAGHSSGGVAATITNFFSSAPESPGADGGGGVRGAPGPIAGAGLPFLFLIVSIAYVIVRRGRMHHEQC